MYDVSIELYDTMELETSYHGLVLAHGGGTELCIDGVPILTLYDNGFTSDRP